MKRELLVQHVGPCVVIVLEVEGPPRIRGFVTSPEERERLEDWMDSSPERRELLAAARLAVEASGGEHVGDVWQADLAKQEGGIVEEIERLLASLKRQAGTPTPADTPVER